MSIEQTEKCSTCGHAVKPFYRRCPKCEGGKNLDKVTRLREVIRELKATVARSIDPDRERELVQLLREYEHPDPDGLLRWIEDQRNQPRQQQQPRKRYA